MAKHTLTDDDDDDDDVIRRFMRPEEDWSDIKKWLETRMKDTIVLRKYSFEGPIAEWTSFDDVVYMTLLNYMENSWIGKYMIQIEALKSHYKSFYCNLMRKPMKKAVLDFINIHNDDWIIPGMFADLFINHIFPEYMRNNVFIGDYLTHTKNIATISRPHCLFVVRNNGNHENGENRRKVFVYTSDWPTMKYNLDGSGLLGLGDDDDKDVELEIASIVGEGSSVLLILDIKGGLHQMRISKNYGQDENGITDPRLYSDRELVKEYWDIKTSTFLPINQLKIIAIYCAFLSDREKKFFLTDAGDIYGELYVEGLTHDRIAFARIPLPSEAQKIVLFSVSSSSKYLVAIDSNNSCFVAVKESFEYRQPLPVFLYLHTFKPVIIMITIFDLPDNSEMIALVTKSNEIIGIILDHHDHNGNMRITLTAMVPLYLALSTEIPVLSKSKRNDMLKQEPEAHVFLPHILRFSDKHMLLMDANNEIGKPILLRFQRSPYLQARLDFTVPMIIKFVRQKIFNLTDINSDIILSVHSSGYNVFILLDNQKLIRVEWNGETEIISTPKEIIVGNWKFECSYCGLGTNMVDPLRLLAFCSEKCSDVL